MALKGRGGKRPKHLHKKDEREGWEEAQKKLPNTNAGGDPTSGKPQPVKRTGHGKNR